MKRIGGQALFHGITMRNGNTNATAIRTETGIELTITQEKIRKKSKIASLPFLRGIVSLAASLKGAVKSIPPRRRKWAFGAILLYLCCVAGLILLETWLETLFSFPNWLSYQLFVCSMLATEVLLALVALRFTPPFRRLFMYHAAEHKTIHCYESDKPLTIENVRMQSRIHPRCGSNIVANLMLLIFLVESFLPPIENDFLYFIVDLFLTLVIFGIAYEGMRYAEKHDNALSRIIGFFGSQMQRYCTTIEPTDDMLECGIAALKGALSE